MKLHRPLVNIVVETLQDIFENGIYADRAVAIVLKGNKSFGSRDRRFIADTIYGVVRWKRMLAAVLNFDEELAQTNYYHLVATWMLLKNIELPEWHEFKGISIEQVNENLAKVKNVRKLRESVPDWLDELASTELGENLWEEELAELNKEALLVLRVNTIKAKTPRVLTRMTQHQVVLQKIPFEIPIWDPIKKNTLVSFKRQKINHLKEFKQGWFEIQDASSQLIAPFLELEPGMTVIDACAGAGGKALHIAAILKNTGKIVAMDVEVNKLRELKKRVHRAGATNIEIQEISENLIKAFTQKADRLLLDVPCSGLGVLKRNPDTKWKLTPARLEELKQKQQRILQDYSVMLKPDGMMVYATCSILPSENEHQVQQFLNNNSSFKLVNEVKVMPSDGFDGFYMASIQKAD